MSIPKRLAQEDGVSLIITLLVLPVLLALGALAVDTAHWYTHKRHLQTQADAAALAASQAFQLPCDSSVVSAITTLAHNYDGNTSVTSPALYNQQITKQGSGVQSLINSSNYSGQSKPGDADVTGSPCTDSAVDVKVTETNVPWYFKLPNLLPGGVPFINAQARVSFEQETSFKGALSPLAEPLPTPNAMSIYLVDEGNNNAVLAGPINLTATDPKTKTNWTGTAAPTFNAKGPVGMEVAEGPTAGSPVTCDNSNGDQCFDTTDSVGITFTRVVSNTGQPGVPANNSPVAPQASSVLVVPQPQSGTACPVPASPTTPFSNFVSSSSQTNVQLCAYMTFTSTGGTSLDCSHSSLTLKTGSNSVGMTCPAGGPNGAWTSAVVPIGPNSGATPFTLSWSVTAGKKPAGSNVTGGDGSGNCTQAQACSGSFDGTTAAQPAVVQRVFSGAYDSQSAGVSHSGGVIAAALTDGSGNELQSVQKGNTATPVGISVSLLSFQNSQAIGTPPLELSFGGNQANALVTCPNQSAGQGAAQTAIALGCQPPNNQFQINSDFSSSPCGTATSPPDCLSENPGNGKLNAVLDDAMNQRIYGTSNSPTCNTFNYWASPNTVTQVLQQPSDPRLLTLVVTDYAALSTGRSAVPIRVLADFYVTGWQGDPCIGHNNGTGANGLAYTGDDDPAANNPATCDPSNKGGTTLQNCNGVLLGHFVQKVDPTGSGGGSGKCVETTALGNCIGVLTK